MSGLKTLLMAFALFPLPSLAADQPLYHLFATCTGRFSAELEHAWLFGDARSEDIERQRKHFELLAEATTPAAHITRAMSWRIEAKVAHAHLLSEVAFSRDAKRSDWAETRAQNEIQYCVSFLLDS